MKTKHIILIVLLIASVLCISPLHEYSEAHRMTHGWGGELLLPMLAGFIWLGAIFGRQTVQFVELMKMQPEDER